MKTLFWTVLRLLWIVESCPNCEADWTSSFAGPNARTHCSVCGDYREGRVTGWVWGRLVDPFCWIGRRHVRRNVKRIYGKDFFKRKDEL